MAGKTQLHTEMVVLQNTEPGAGGVSRIEGHLAEDAGDGCGNSTALVINIVYLPLCVCVCVQARVLVYAYVRVSICEGLSLAS